MADSVTSTAITTPDEDLDLHRLHCRYAIRWGADMQKANRLWAEMQGQYSSRTTHISALAERLKAQNQQSPETSFSHAEVFPIVTRVIMRALPDASGFVPHDTIVSGLLADTEGARIIRHALLASSLRDDRSVASNMVAWFSQQISVGRSRWTEFFDRVQQGGAWSYRPKTALAPPIAPDAELAAVEGDPRLFFHIRQERSSLIARAKREAMRTSDGQLLCEICGFSLRRRYPGIAGDICEVHHRTPLGEIADAVTTRLDDLALLCPNCHRAIHRTDPLMTVESFRARFFGSQRANNSVEDIGAGRAESSR